MGAKRDKMLLLIEQVDQLIEDILKHEERFATELASVHPSFLQSARNLVHYRAIRRHDLREIQTKLGHLGLSRLARSQAHTLASLQSTRTILAALAREKAVGSSAKGVSIKRAEKLLRSHTKALFGNRSKGRRVRIMVTLPTQAATDYRYVLELARAGMNSARINCAHDGPEEWGGMIDHVRRASNELRRKIRVCMDLGGPKIRTGPITAGPRVVSYAPERDVLGKVVGPATVCLVPDGAEHPIHADTIIPVPKDWLDALQVGDHVYFRDTRSKKRRLEVVSKDECGCWAVGYDRSYVETGTELFRNDWEGIRGTVGELPPIQQRILLRTNDHIVLHADSREGESALLGVDGSVVSHAHISCTNGEIFDHVAVGDPVRFDDGKIEGVVIDKVPSQSLEIEVTYTKVGGQRLGADKGINFPDSRLAMRGLTDKDRIDLKFVAANADVVNMSFVNTPQDVEDLIEAIEQADAKDKLGVVLKIETQQGFDNLTRILLTAMKMHPVGVMIARGDLAVETGWERMAVIQDEILSLCTAAHIPEVWATQVLENLAKKGLPSRAEVTDAASSIRAECVMLNKGAHIHRAVEMLDSILKNMKDYRHNKAPMSPPMIVAESR